MAGIGLMEWEPGRSLFRLLGGGIDDDGGGEIGHEVGVGLIELEDCGESS